MASVAGRAAVAAREFRRSYAEAFDAFVRDRSERELHAAYELGRDAVRQELSVLDLALVHHGVLLDALRHGSPDDVTTAASSFFLEALSSFEMVQRGFREAREAAALERRQADMLRQLSNFLADASLALGASESLEEMLQLVAEQARELIGAEACLAVVDLGQPGATIEAVSRADEVDRAQLKPVSLSAPLLTLDGRELGSIRLFGKADGSFSDLDEAVLVQLAQMASAAVERSRLYARAAPRRPRRS